jgi:hypothetical protein
MFDARKTGLLLAACAIVGLSASRVSASVIDFEDGTLGPFASGHGVGVLQTPIGDSSEPNGYNQVGLYTNSDHVAFNPFAASPADFIRTDAADFDLNSFVIAGAWGSQTLTLQGYNNGSLIHSQTLVVGFDSNSNQIPQLVTLNWAGIDDFRILTGSDFVRNNTLGSDTSSDIRHWALDNLTINEPINGGGGGGNNDVPEPGTVAMFVGMGVTSLVALRRRRK